MLFRRDRVRLGIRLSLVGFLFVLGFSVTVACGFHVNRGPSRLTTTVTTNGSVTTIVTGP